jgi:hypothetical protein
MLRFTICRQAGATTGLVLRRAEIEARRGAEGETRKAPAGKAQQKVLAHQRNRIAIRVQLGRHVGRLGFAAISAVI